MPNSDLEDPLNHLCFSDYARLEDNQGEILKTTSLKGFHNDFIPVI